MLGAYTVPLIVSFLLFPFVGLLALFPFAFRSYRKYGQLGRLHSMVFYSFVLYAIGLVCFVTLPLPVITSTFCQDHHTTPRLQLFAFIADISALHLRTFIDVVRSGPFLQAFFNVLFFAPLGFYLRYYFRNGIVVAALVSFGVSLLVETSQLTGLFGIYPCSYRFFDVDDLFTNTVGGICGYLLTAGLAFLPQPAYVSPELLRRVSPGRSIMALLFDLFFLAGAPLLSFIAIVGTLVGVYDYTPPLAFNGVIFATLLFVFGALDFLIIPLAWRGFTIGKFIVDIRLASPNGHPATYGMIAVRYLTLAFPVTALWLLGAALTWANNDNLFTTASAFTEAAVILANLIAVLANRQRVSLGGLISEAKNVVA